MYKSLKHKIQVFFNYFGLSDWIFFLQNVKLETPQNH